ncbi:hypothetical protein TcasGA2_TC012750 [Tribolium castaneum]|uniref:Uncharacterized protein n=1 Tax=Tribolium castaneum TaxID=7070 RepID=D6WZZ7_TRICA|nr:hypothetical protein TcasGA2_TC012750 [Tribolium castaneum]
MNLLELVAGLNGAFLDYTSDGVVPGWLFSMDYMPWLWAMIGSALVGLSGVLPLLVIPIDQTDNLKQGGSFFCSDKSCKNLTKLVRSIVSALNFSKHNLVSSGVIFLFSFASVNHWLIWSMVIFEFEWVTALNWCSMFPQPDIFSLIFYFTL